MAGNRDPQRRPVLYDLKNQRLLADPAIGSTYHPVVLSGGGGGVLTPADIGVTVQGYDSTLLNAADVGVTVQGYDANLLTASAIGVTVQGYDADLAAIAGLTGSADRFPYYTGAGSAALAVLTPAARTVLEDSSIADMRDTLGVDAAFTVTTTSTSKTLTDREHCSIATSGLTLTLPSSPQVGWEVRVSVIGSFTDTIISRNSENIMSLAEDLTVDRGDITISLVYIGATYGWRII